MQPESPQPSIPIKLRKRTPEEAVLYQTQKLVHAMDRIRALEYGRWATFSRRELIFLSKGLEAVVLQLQTGSSVQTLAEAQELLSNLTSFLDDHTHPGDHPLARQAKDEDQNRSRAGE